MRTRSIYINYSVKTICCFMFFLCSWSLYAQGPTQPEVNSFTPVGADQLVNTATGDFTYQIPLLDVG